MMEDVIDPVHFSPPHLLLQQHLYGLDWFISPPKGYTLFPQPVIIQTL